MVASGDGLSEITGWGRYPRVRAREVAISKPGDCAPAARLSRGWGRSYGDASLPPVTADGVADDFANRGGEGRPPASVDRRAGGDPHAANWRFCDRILDWDPESLRIRVEAGAKLSDLIEVALRHGAFVPVTPGTGHVTVGGMVACDVHGKNHHRAGTFGSHVRSLGLRTADGEWIEVSRRDHPDLFLATLGGCGLTGHIAEVEFDLSPVPTGWLVQESVCTPNWHALVETLYGSARDWPFTAAWSDLLARGSRFGRGVVYRARWADASEASARTRVPTRSAARSLPWYPRITESRIRAFNRIYFAQARMRGSRPRLATPSAVFHPLDRVDDWPRFYGPNGFAQYQCVLPRHGSVADHARRVISALQGAGAVCCLAVIKDCGPEGDGLLSFPRDGLSLAIDFPIRDREEAQRIHDDANETLIGFGGRIYLAKDAFTRRDHFEAMEPRLEEWRRIRNEVDPRQHFRSQLGDRLLMVNS